MINEVQQWGDFSEWLDRIQACVEREQSQMLRTASEEATGTDVTFEQVLHVLQQWVSRVQDAPMTTWMQELEVRGYDFPHPAGMEDGDLSERLARLAEQLAGIGVFLINTDHLSDRELYASLVLDLLNRPIALVSMDMGSETVVDMVGLEVQEDPMNWLTYYASSRERMEWAKQNPGKGLPMARQAPYARDAKLPRI
jgi:hypothetical protein